MNITFNQTISYTPPLKEIVGACVEIPNILIMLIISFVVTTAIMFIIAKIEFKHKNDKLIRLVLVNLCFIVLCFIGIMTYYAYTF